jgi:hypothetical protein
VQGWRSCRKARWRSSALMKNHNISHIFYIWCYCVNLICASI